MSDAITVVAPKDVTEAKALAKDLALSALMPQALRKKPEDVLAIVLAGAEIGLAPMTAVRGMEIIQGNLSMKSALMGALVMSKPVCEYLTIIESSDKIATFEAKRRGSPAPVRMSFTIEEARTAGLASKDNWKKNPTAMLLARCQARICRAVFPDLVMGVYDRDSGELDEVVERDVTPQKEHVASVKETLRAAVTAPVASVVEGEIVTEPSVAEKIAAATTLDALNALVPEIKTLSDADRAALGPVFLNRRNELSKETK